MSAQYAQGLASHLRKKRGGRGGEGGKDRRRKKRRKIPTKAFMEKRSFGA